MQAMQLLNIMELLNIIEDYSLELLRRGELATGIQTMQLLNKLKDYPQELATRMLTMKRLNKIKD